MRVAHFLIREASGLYYFRLRVPAGLRAALGRKLIKRATGTRCTRTAMAYAAVWALRYARHFQELRRARAMARSKPPHIEDITRAASEGRVREYTLSHPSGFSVQADGPEDHARALEMIGRVSELAWKEPAPSLTVNRIRLQDAVAKWLAAIEAKNKIEKTRAAKKKAVVGFAEWKQSQLGPSVAIWLDGLTRSDCADWHIYLAALKLDGGTISNKFIYLVGFFDWAMTAGHYPRGDNPAAGHAKWTKEAKRQSAMANGWQAFTPEQIAAIFVPYAYASMSSEDSLWIPLIALYTGARSNEIGRLHTKDFKEEKGIKFFDFNFVGADKRLKTTSSVRRTPVHPDLIALGLWKRVERLRMAGEKKLFPRLSFDAQNGPANAAQRAFLRYLERQGIRADGGKLGHHSFRDTVIQRLQAAGVPPMVYDEYVGHGESDKPDHRYSYEHRPEDLPAPAPLSLAGLAKACHPPLDFGLNVKAFAQLLHMAGLTLAELADIINSAAATSDDKAMAARELKRRRRLRNDKTSPTKLTTGKVA